MRSSVSVCVVALSALWTGQVCAFGVNAQEIARIGDQMPGQTTGTNFADFEYGVIRHEPAMATGGTVVFVAGSSSEFRTGLYSGNGAGSPIELTRFGSGRPVQAISTLSVGGGAVALGGFDASIAYTAFLLAADVAGGSVTTVAKEGTLVDGVPLRSGALDDVGIDNLGNVAFGGRAGVYVQRFGNPITVVRPDPNNPQVFSENVDIGDGRVVYGEFAADNAFQAVDDNNLWQTSGTVRQLSVDSTDLVPGTTKTWAADNDSFADPFRASFPVVDGNQMFFQARRGLANFGAEFDGIYRATLRSQFSAADRDHVVAVARAGDPVPGIPGAQFTSFRGHSADAGMAIFLAGYSGSSNGTGLFGAVGSFLFPILTTGNVVPSATGNQTVTAITRLGRDAIQGGSIATVFRLGGGSIPAIYRLDLGPGNSQSSALTPSTTDGKQFSFELELGENGVGVDFPIWLDPPATNGYDFASDGANFASVTLPTGFLLDALGEEQPFTINFGGFSEQAFGGETVLFTDLLATGVEAFEIRGIGDTTFADNATIAAGLTFLPPQTGNIGQFTVTQTAVPEPATLFALAMLGGLAILRRPPGARP